LDIDKLKSGAIKKVESQRTKLVALSHRIHDNPEPGFKEVKASKWLSAYLETNGFTVERGICRLPTAFRATYGSGKPAIALMAEYDALPEIGHACGHNIICTAAISAAVAAKSAVDQYGGRIVVLGTPAEEMFGGKAIMAERGAFKDIDIAMLVHPSSHDLSSARALACITLEVEFSGKAAHAAARPEEGINALEALILSFNGINSLRQHINERARIHGIITKGGDAPNVVPDHTSGTFLVRAVDDAYLKELKVRVLSCFQAAALATGAHLKYTWKEYYAPLRANTMLAEVMAANMRAIGRKPQPIPDRASGSSDVGNVSMLVPTIHPEVAIAKPKTSLHSVEFRTAAVSTEGDRGLIDGAKALALTVVDLLANPKTVAAIRKEFLAAK
jgi:metal-dependent amidase/aminoacylase/carboxypeptidase family protein